MLLAMCNMVAQTCVFWFKISVPWVQKLSHSAHA